MSSAIVDTDLHVTPAALTHIKKMLAKRGNGIGMRLAVKNGGCSGKEYVNSLIDNFNPDDHVYQIDENVVLCVDPVSYMVICGTTIDYVRSGFTGKFVYNNPNEKASCGCGESFYA